MKDWDVIESMYLSSVVCIYISFFTNKVVSFFYIENKTECIIFNCWLFYSANILQIPMANEGVDGASSPKVGAADSATANNKSKAMVRKNNFVMEVTWWSAGSERLACDNHLEYTSLSKEVATEREFDFRIDAAITARLICRLYD